MKKLSTILAASALAVVATQASALDIPYDIALSGTTTGGATGTTTGTGVALITVDQSDYAIPGQMTMTIDSYVESSTTYGSLAADVTSVITGTFDVLTFLGGGGLVLNAVTNVTSCTPYGSVFGNTVCSNLPPANDPFVPSNVVVAPDASLVTFDVITVNSTPLGSVTASNQYVLTQAPAVPVPAAAWLFGSALVGLAGVGRKRKMA